MTKSRVPKTFVFNLVVLMLAIAAWSEGNAHSRVATKGVAPAASSQVPPSIVVLDVEGEAFYQRPHWKGQQRLLPGMVLAIKTDYVYARSARFTFLCPSGSVFRDRRAERWNVGIEIETEASKLCGTNARSASYRFEPESPNIIDGFRGTTEDQPYLISPRNTAVSEVLPSLRWHVLNNAELFTIAIKQNQQDFGSIRPLKAQDVVSGTVASYVLTQPISQTTGYTYTVKICARVTVVSGSPERCADPATFYFWPRANVKQLDTALRKIEADQQLPPTQQWYANAMLLAQPIPSLSPTGSMPIGYYAEAIANIEQLITTQPSSRLGQSPMPYIFLGQQYRAVGLERMATQAYRLAASKAAVGSEAQAQALWGIGLTTNKVSDVDAALAAYHDVLDSVAFAEQVKKARDFLSDRGAELTHTK